MTAVARVLVIGAGGHARVVLDAARAAGQAVIGLPNNDLARAGCVVDGARVLGSLAQLGAMAVTADGVIVGLGDAGMRRAVHRRVRETELPPAQVVHPRAVVAYTATLGAGSVVLASAVVCPGVAVGEGVIVNAGAVIDHDAQIGDFAHIATGAVVSARARIGAGVLIESGRCVAQGEFIVAAPGSEADGYVPINPELEP